MSIDKEQLARRFFALNAGERGRFLAALRQKGIRFDRLPMVGGIHDKEAPLAPLQRRLWLLHRTDPENTAYHLTGAFELRGPVNKDSLVAALEAVQRRHAPLRTRFFERGGKAWQVIDSTPTLSLTYHDRTQGPPDGADALAQAEIQRPFDLERDGAFRVLLVHLPENRWRLLIVLHHIIADAWSIGIFLEELRQALRAVEAEDAALPALAVEYADYAVWQEACLEAGEEERQLAYWRGRLNAQQPYLLVPYDKTVNAGEPRLAATLQIPLPRVQPLAQTLKASPFTVMLSAWMWTLAVHSGRYDVQLGVPVADRSRPETAPLIGFFINTIVMRGEIDPAQSVSAWIGEMQARFLEAQEHQSLPFDRLVEAIAPRRTAEETPLFQALFNYRQNAAFSESLTPTLSMKPLPQGVPHALFDLALDVDEDENGSFSATLTYASNRFAEQTAVRLAKLLERVVETFIGSPESALGSLDLLSSSDAALLRSWAERPADYDRGADFVDLVAAQAAAQPEAVALVHGQERVSYAELERRSTAIARWLQAQGAGPETVVGVALERGTAMIAAFLGALKAGAAFLPLDPDYPPERLRHMLDDSGAPLLLTSSDLTDRLTLPEATRTVALDQLDIDQLQFAEQPQDSPLPPVHPDQLAYIIYTSGSTGQPKGVAVTRRGLAMHVQTIGQRYGMTPEDTELLFASISFDGALERWTVPLAFGARLVIRDQALWSAEQTCEALISEGVTIACFPPSYAGPLLDWIEHARPDLPLRSWTLGGEAFTRETYHRLQRLARPPRIINGYGPTETVVTPMIWEAYPDTPLDSAYAPIGTPVGERRAYVLDQTLNPVPPGSPGELYIGGEAGLARGYHGRPELTAERFLPDPFGPPGERMYRTGDRVRWRDDGVRGGVMEYLGRADQQIKIRGFRIEPGEIEARLMALPELREAVVVAQSRDGEAAAAMLVAYVVPAENGPAGDIDSRAIQQRLGEDLPAYMVPARIVALPSLPLTPAGKVDRQALPAPAIGPAAQEAPQGAAEEAMAAIWQRLLKCERLGRQDSFFELGGDSILALQVVAQARQAGWQIRPNHLFQHQTLAAVAQAATPQDAKDRNHAAQAPVTGPAKLTPIQAHFFALNPRVPSHWNQHLWLEAQAPLDLEALAAALLALRAHHDALRLRFERHDGAWRQRFLAPDAPPRDLPADLLWHRQAADDAEAEALCTQAQQSLDIETGPLLRALYLTQPGRPDRLLLTIHHLAVDGVSWRILIEDLRLAYSQAAAGQEIRLPDKTGSLKDWTEALAKWPGASEQIPFWQAQDAGLAEETARIGDCGRHRLELDKAQTQTLLKKGGDVLAVLLAALVQAKEQSLVVNLEGHGRRTDIVAPDLDLSRTVGWFTSLYPLRLDRHEEPRTAVAAVSERLRAAERDGTLGYGVLRFLQGEAASLPALAPITFNYLGQYRLDSAKDWLVPAAGGGLAQDPDNPLAAPLTINAQVLDGVLSMEWLFSRHRYSPEDIETLTRRYRAALCDLLQSPRVAGQPGSIKPGAPEAGDARVLVTLTKTEPAKKEPAQIALFCPHPVTGRVNGYHAIARVLQGRRAVHGLQSLSCVEPGYFDDSLAQIAERYTQTIKAAQPEGPYALLGWSLGGSLALDIAKRLERAGEEVAFLGLLDPYVPGFEVAEDVWPAPEMRETLATHLKTLLPELAERAIEDCLARLAEHAPRDWPVAAAQWLEDQPIGSYEAADASELLFSFALEQHHRQLCSGYGLPKVDTAVHAWWAGIPRREGEKPWEVLGAKLRFASSEVVDADHLGIVRNQACLDALADLLSPEDLAARVRESVGE